MLHIYYIKTPAGQEEMNARGPGLNARERQIMLMCSGQRPLQVLIELFGESVVRELHELVVQGYLQAVRRPPSARSDPASGGCVAGGTGFRIRPAADAADAHAGFHHGGGPVAGHDPRS